MYKKINRIRVEILIIQPVEIVQHVELRISVYACNNSNVELVF